MGLQTLSSLGRMSAIVVILHLCIVCPDMGCESTCTLPPCYGLVVVLLYIFGCRRSFSGRFWSFLSMVAL